MAQTQVQILAVVVQVGTNRLAVTQAAMAAMVVQVMQELFFGHKEKIKWHTLQK
jgi:hypothetical protein